jgi:hypothetical protein
MAAARVAGLVPLDRGLAGSLLLFAAVRALTDAGSMADTVDYVREVVAFERCGGEPLWEVGHLYWRPLGLWLHLALGPVAAAVVGPDPHLQVAFLLIALNGVLGAAGVVLAYAIARHLTGSRWAAVLAAAALVFSHAFLNFTQSGTAYAAGLAPLLAALLLLVTLERRSPVATALLAGAALAASLCLWLPYVWAVPGVLLAPLLLARARVPGRLVVGAGSALAGGLAVALAVAFADMGIHDPAGAAGWLRSSPSIGLTHTSGAARAAFGIVRSFVDTGRDGLVVKRFLLDDPLNPVSPRDLLGLGLWRLPAFYGLLGLAALPLALGPGLERRVLAAAAAIAVPVVAFGVAFDGGAVERYLPLLPAFLLVVATAAGGSGPGERLAVGRWATAGLVAVMAMVNVFALRRPTLAEEGRRAVARLQVLEPLAPASRVLTVNWQDELVNFNRSRLFHPANRYDRPLVNALVTPGTVSASRWREQFARQALEAWVRGGDVWVSSRALARRPRPEWNWVEGVEPEVSWKDFSDFFSGLDRVAVRGGADGFFLVGPTPANLTRLAALTAPEVRRAGS